MPLVSYSAKEALAEASRNKHRVWGHATDKNSVRVRVAEGDLLAVAHKPKFELDLREPVFTIGSCFAREVEHVLVRLGVPLTVQGYGIQAEYYQTWDGTRGGGVEAGKTSRGAFNKYSVSSMTSEVRRVLLDEQFENEGLIELDKDKWFDPHASSLRELPFDLALSNRKIISDATRTIRKAKTVVITLGLTEGWVDKVTGLGINTHPGAKWLSRHSDRFQFVDYGYREIADELGTMIDLIRNNIGDVKIILTVSPVPLGTTFKGVDIVTANTGSKATLRAVANEMYASFDFVDYFPSYEMVTHSKREAAFAEDLLHVRSTMVQHIMSVFKQSYYPVAA